VPEDEMVDALVEWGQKVVAEGVEGALRDADAAAAAEAEKDRNALLEEQGEDANASEQRVEVIRKL
jgi:(E)-4-hydroxy-3-methylbut-2-enyl-diphosphate synthase